MKFPSIYKLFPSDGLRPWLDFAIVEDGRIVATNGYILVYSQLSAFVKNAELAESKVFDKKMMRWMTGAKIRTLTCTQTGIEATFKDGSIKHHPYSGHIKPDKFERRTIVLPKDKKNIESPFPNWKSVIPLDKTFFDFEGLRMTNLSSVQLSLLINCFTLKKYDDALNFHFSGVGSVIKVTACDEHNREDGEQVAVIMPKLK